MVATPLTPSVRYFPAGTRKFYWVAAIADETAPTRMELDAGTDLTGEVVAGGVSGFQTTTANLDVPDADSDFTGSIPGRTTVAASSILLYADDDSDDARSLLTKGTAGYIVIFPEGDVAANKMNVFPVRISSSSMDQDTEKAGQLMVEFTVTSKPAENVTVPA